MSFRGRQSDRDRAEAGPTRGLFRSGGVLLERPSRRDSVYLELNARLQAEAIALGGKVTDLDPEEARHLAPDSYDRAWESWKRRAAQR